MTEPRNDVLARFDRWSAKPQTGSIAEGRRWVSFAGELRDEIVALRADVAKARDLIGDQPGDITGAALDAWVLLSETMRKRESSGDGDVDR